MPRCLLYAVLDGLSMLGEREFRSAGFCCFVVFVFSVCFSLCLSRSLPVVGVFFLQKSAVGGTECRESMKVLQQTTRTTTTTIVRTL